MSTNPRDNVNSPQAAIPPTAITALTAALASDNVVTRQNARQALVDIGRPAVPALIGASDHQNWRVRWEAVKALSEIADPSSAPALVRRIVEDEHDDIRWIAERGLIVIGREGLAPLMQALIEHADSIWVLQGAHHILHVLARRGLSDLVSPVLAAIEGPAPQAEVPFRAEAALHKLEEAPE
ncbi:MAG: HEAT repeat domain-containing protein [Bacteroidetes bacterium]|nr:HEAT repeat domain-containing protein [Bacteroidota bacterium]MCL5025467.1 HEAT repeat domain-containing protein [Chloroflexota bacterium]